MLELLPAVVWCVSTVLFDPWTHPVNLSRPNRIARSRHVDSVVAIERTVNPSSCSMRVFHVERREKRLNNDQQASALPKSQTDNLNDPITLSAAACRLLLHYRIAYVQNNTWKHNTATQQGNEEDDRDATRRKTARKKMCMNNVFSKKWYPSRAASEEWKTFHVTESTTRQSRGRRRTFSTHNCFVWERKREIWVLYSRKFLLSFSFFFIRWGLSSICSCNSESNCINRAAISIVSRYVLYCCHDSSDSTLSFRTTHISTS